MSAATKMLAGVEEVAEALGSARGRLGQPREAGCRERVEGEEGDGREEVDREGDRRRRARAPPEHVSDRGGEHGERDEAPRPRDPGGAGPPDGGPPGERRGAEADERRHEVASGNDVRRAPEAGGHRHAVRKGDAGEGERAEDPGLDRPRTAHSHATLRPTLGPTRVLGTPAFVVRMPDRTSRASREVRSSAESGGDLALLPRRSGDRSVGSVTNGWCVVAPSALRRVAYVAPARHDVVVMLRPYHGPGGRPGPSGGGPMHEKLTPKVILEGTRLTGKTELAFALNEHSR